MKQHMHGALQEIMPLRRVPPFRAAAKRTCKLRLGNAGKPSLLTRHVQQTEREAAHSSPAPPTPLTPHHDSPSSQSSSSRDNSEQHGLLSSDKALQPPTTASPRHSSTNADSASSSTTAEAEPSIPAPAHVTDHVPHSAASPSPNQQPSDPAPGPSSPRQRRQPFAFQKPAAATVLATYGAYVGAIGTLAVGTAWATDINLASMFQWSPQAAEQALLTLVPLAALNTLIMLPDYSNWSLPNLDEKEAEAALPFSQTSPAETTASAVPSLAASTSAAAPTSDGEASISGRSTVVGAEGVGAEGVAAAAAAAASSQRITKTPAAAWGKKRGVTRILKDAMNLAQGHYTANNPTVNMSPAVEVVTASAQSLAAELLYRGVVMTLLQTWVLDRLYEAGADDVMLLPFQSQPMDTSDAALWGASWLLVAMSVGLALRKVYHAPRPRIIQILDLKGKAKGKEGGATSPAAATAAEQIPRSFHQVTTLAGAVQGARNVLQTLVLNTVFVMSGGNLAASVSASLVNQLLFSFLQRNSTQRMQKRSATLAKELEAFNLRLREIARKKQARRAAAAAPAAPAAPAATAATGDKPTVAPVESLGSGVWEPSLDQSGAGEAEGSLGLAAQMHDSLHREGAAAAQGAGGGEVLLHAAAVATAASAAVDAAADAAASAQGSGVVAAAAAAGGGGMGPGQGQLGRALMALDLLLPPEPPKK